VEEESMLKSKIAVVIPAFKVRTQILQVLSKIGPEVDLIYVINDACPEDSGQLVDEKIKDPRVHVLYNTQNLGVGGSVKRGYQASLEAGSTIIIKIDGDGQMDPTLIPKIIKPIQEGRADYAKGNRFYNIEKIKLMPKARIIGNIFLSFFSKISTGYWHVFDPNNGFTAISSEALSQIPFEKISMRYFFESDMLFRLNSIRAVVVDVPMDANYGLETSNLSPLKSIFEFGYKHSRNLVKRLFYNYFLREFTVASLQLIMGSILLTFSTIYGFTNWLHSQSLGIATQTGTLILVMISFLSGLQLLLGFLAYDMSNSPKEPLTRKK